MGGSIPDPYGHSTPIDKGAVLDLSTPTAVFTDHQSTGLGVTAYVVRRADTARNRMVAYGGTNNTMPSFNVKASSLGAQLYSSQVVSGSHPPVSDAPAVVDPVDNQLLMFVNSNVYRLGLALGTAGNPMVWSSPAVSGAVPTSVSEPHFVAGGNVVVACGVDKKMDAVSTMSLDGMWTDYSVPHPAALGNIVLCDPAAHRVIVHGFYTPYANEVWELSLDDPNSWTKLAPTGASPPAQDYVCGTYESLRRRSSGFGGYASGVYFSDAYTLSLDGAPTWAALATSTPKPPGRKSATMIYDPLRDRILMWGGVDASGARNDLWELTLGTNPPTWTQLAPTGTAPAGYAGLQPQAVYDPVRDQMLLARGELPSSEVWALSLASLTWTRLPDPALNATSLAYDPARNWLIAFGSTYGSNHSTSLKALPLLTPAAWQPLQMGGIVPSLAYRPFILNDPISGRLVAFPDRMYSPNSAANGSSYWVTFSSRLDVPPTSADDDLELRPIRPNPATSAATFDLSVGRAGRVDLAVFDLAGRRVRTLATGRMIAGRHSIAWDLRSDV